MHFVNKVIKTIFCAALFITTQSSQADVLVLVHGYMGSPMSWERSNINNELAMAGWQRGGIIVPDTEEYFPAPSQQATQNAANITYVIDMPWMRTIDIQAEYLNTAMDMILSMRPNERISLVGHSAGALAARLWLVENYDPAVVRLVSIAAPNLGTKRAFDALDLTDPVFTPFDAVRNMFGGKLYNTVRRSRDLVQDFTPPSQQNPTVLHWLNHQTHPDIDYISIVREDRRGSDKDWLITADSQDLNNVPALYGKSTTYIVPQKHQLHIEDGILLSSILPRR